MLLRDGGREPGTGASVHCPWPLVRSVGADLRRRGELSGAAHMVPIPSLISDRWERGWISLPHRAQGLGRTGWGVGGWGGAPWRWPVEARPRR